jgi:glutathione S-transferase
MDEVKPKLITKNPAVTLPYLLDGDKVISESTAILVYLCHKANRTDLLGRNAEEQVSLFTAYGVYKDFHPNYIRMVYGKYDENNTFDQALSRSLQDFVPYLTKLNGILGDN